MRAELLAALAALCWAVGSVLSAHAASQMGAFAFSRWRLFFAMCVLGVVAALTGHWRGLDLHAVGILVLSGLVGIFVGDSALFACMNRLGPRRCGILFATHAVFSALLAWPFLGETLWGWTLVGSGLLVSGVMVAIAWGRRADESHRWEDTRGTLAVGVALGLLAALCQAVATLMIKPLMSTGIDAVSASAIRTTTAFVAHLVMLWGGVQQSRLLQPLTTRLVLATSASGVVAMALGMTLILLALRTGQANLVAIMASISPVLILPLLWLIYRRRPALGAWVGSAMAVLGTAIILA
ncbi:MAG: DMT family transporter [Betaproteobacteria bacterium]